jgi:hypothetical protein
VRFKQRVIGPTGPGSRGFRRGFLWLRQGQHGYFARLAGLLDKPSGLRQEVAEGS